MDSTLPERGARRSAGPEIRLSPLTAILLAVSCGLAGGYLDLLFIIFKKFFWNGLKNYANAADFPWSVPVGHMVLLLVPGVLLAVLSRLRPKPMSLRAAAWLFATLAIWAALLRMPLYGVASLLLAAGLGRRLSGPVAALYQRPRRAWYTALGLVGPLVILGALSSGWRALGEYRAVAGLPAPPPNARNVILIVWDAVRATNLSLYGHPRDTTPNLARWARKGVCYSVALAPAPWTYPSHTSFFTGHWPFQLSTQWKYTLDAPVPTLAEHLTSRGYLTAGFSANTLCCTYETRLDRGFSHFEDYPFTPRSLLSRTAAGSWILENIFSRDDFYDFKWIRIQSRDATAINHSFLDWLKQRPRDRPFFAYLNYFDAHEPYMPPPGYAGRFGISPRNPRDYQFLLDYGSPGWKTLPSRDINMARDCYDDCIAFIDDRMGQLLDELNDQGLLDNTVVIITSDHGESFGDHGFYLHGTSLYLDETGVPLVILSPDAPAGRVVDQPVSLRDLPATVVDRLGLSAGSPFPGRSLAAYWSPAGAALAESTPVLSEHATETAFQQPEAGKSLRRRDVQMSLVARDRHYIRDGFGSEKLYNLSLDPFETVNLAASPEGKQVVEVFRRMLLDVLAQNRGTIAAENAYLVAYRQWLKSIIAEGPPARQPISARDVRSNEKRE
ncbi:MAG: sulfatase-like hydrolase/transferase [Isosphaeraceae bacterium]